MTKDRLQVSLSYFGLTSRCTQTFYDRFELFLWYGQLVGVKIYVNSKPCYSAGRVLELVSRDLEAECAQEACSGLKLSLGEVVTV